MLSDLPRNPFLQETGDSPHQIQSEKVLLDDQCQIYELGEEAS